MAEKTALRWELAPPRIRNKVKNLKTSEKPKPTKRSPQPSSPKLTSRLNGAQEDQTVAGDDDLAGQAGGIGRHVDARVVVPEVDFLQEKGEIGF